MLGVEALGIGHDPSAVFQQEFDDGD